MLGLLTGLCAVIGVAVGSFLNVVIYRVPNHLSIVAPRSSCPTCKTQLSNRDNIPIVSWLVLKGRCRTCAAPISPRYLVVEAATGVLFAGVALRYDTNPAVPALLVLVAGLLALACIDLEHHTLPRVVVYPVLAMVAVLLFADAAAGGRWRELVVAIACAAAWFIVFFAINFISPRHLGFGDVRLALVLGLGLGWLGVYPTLIGFFAANLVGAVAGGVLIATKRISRDTQIPYGVFLAVGAAVAIYVGPVVHLRLRGV